MSLLNSASSLGEAGFVDRPDLSFRRAMPAALGTLDDARDTLINRVRRHEDHVGCEAAEPRELRLLDRGFRPQRRFHGERMRCLDVPLHEALAFFSDSAANMPRDGAIAAQI